MQVWFLVIIFSVFSYELVNEIESAPHQVSTPPSDANNINVVPSQLRFS